MFFANLNVFVALLCLLNLVMAGPLSIVGMAVLQWLGYTGIASIGHAYLFSYPIIGIALAIVWWKSGLSPATTDLDRRTRYRLGHWVIGIANLAHLMPLLLRPLLAQLADGRNVSVLLLVFFPAYLGAVIAWPIGLAMIWTSRR